MRGTKSASLLVQNSLHGADRSSRYLDATLLSWPLYKQMHNPCSSMLNWLKILLSCRYSDHTLCYQLDLGHLCRLPYSTPPRDDKAAFDLTSSVRKLPQKQCLLSVQLPTQRCTGASSDRHYYSHVVYRQRAHGLSKNVLAQKSKADVHRIADDGNWNIPYLLYQDRSSLPSNSQVATNLFVPSRCTPCLGAHLAGLLHFPFIFPSLLIITQ